jgi:chromosome segregation ATPase
MENFNTPTREDLQAYRVLINSLREAKSLQEDINEEMERSIQLLKEQKAILEQQDCAIQDLSSNLSDYVEEANDLLDGLKDKAVLLAEAMTSIPGVGPVELPVERDGPFLGSEASPSHL